MFSDQETQSRERHFADHVMKLYSKGLLEAKTKVAVFAALLAVLAWRVSLMKQYFDFTTVVPRDSYIKTWYVMMCVARLSIIMKKNTIFIFS